MSKIKFADYLCAISGDSYTRLPSPLAASKQSEFHEALLKRVQAAARLLRIDLPLNEPVDAFMLNSQLSARYKEQPSAKQHGMVLKDCLWRMGAYEQ